MHYPACDCTIPVGWSTTNRLCCNSLTRPRISRDRIWQNLAQISGLYVRKNFSSNNCFSTALIMILRICSVLGRWMSSSALAGVTRNGRGPSEIVEFVCASCWKASLIRFRFFLLTSDNMLTESLSSAFIRLFVRMVDVMRVFQPLHFSMVWCRPKLMTRFAAMKTSQIRKPDWTLPRTFISFYGEVVHRARWIEKCSNA